MMPPEAVEVLRRVNLKFRSALLRLRPEHRHCSTLRPQDLSDVLSHVLEATDCLRNIDSRFAAEGSREDVRMTNEAAKIIEKEALEYRGHLENLKRFLPDLHLRLLAERARLETARAHLSAAASWAGASKKTL
ncbi:MAG: hypothetical protein WCC32_13425 [Terriglobales bacterium]